MPSPTIFFPATTSYRTFAYTHLPEFESLDRYENKWAFSGTLTYAKTPPLPSTQLKDFIHLMKSLGMLNHSHPDLLHYFVRVEHSPSARWHLHFLLGHERVTNGRHTPMTVQTACDFLSTHWFHGNAEVVPSDRSEDGVGYITKMNDRDLIGETRMSPSLVKVLKNLPHSVRREDECAQLARYQKENRDEVAAELLTKLRRVGSNVCFMDEAPSRRVA